MLINFSSPYFLLLIPVSVAFTVFFAVKRMKGTRFNRAFYAIVRSIVFTLVILALSGTVLKEYTNLTSTVAAVDISASTKGSTDGVIAFFKEASETATKDDMLGVVCFGENAVVEVLPSQENTKVPFSSFGSFVSDSFTNISSGLKLAHSIIDEKTKKRIVLVSDGQENIDEAITQAKLLKEQGIVVNVLPVQNTIANEVQLTEIKIPKYIKKDTSYEIEIVGHSLKDTSASLLIYKNNTLIKNVVMDFRKGENKYVLTDETNTTGGVIYRAEVVPTNSAEDTFTQNNVVHGYSYVEGAPNVLLIESNGSGVEIQKMLSTSRVNVVIASPQTAPIEPELLNIYDCIILANVSIDQLPEQFPDALEAYVRVQGGGVIATGGDNSFALGNYNKTPLETLLPVDMELKDKKDLPNLGMVVVIDRSGSMGVGQFGVSKLELAKESVIRSVETLNDNDQFGVIAFDDGFIWASKFQLVDGNIGGIKDNIAKIQLGGGTTIYPALLQSYNTLVGADTKLKHVILLTDGQGEGANYDSLVNSMAQAGITLSTVAVGVDSDKKLMEHLAELGNGRYYFTDEFSDLPKIFTKETQLAGKNYINNESFYPTVSYSGTILSGISSLPMLHGYISTTEKQRADVYLYSENDEPILAAWQYGLGRSAAWTSDMDGVFSSDWISTEQGINVFKNTLSWVIRSQLMQDINISTKVLGNDSEINVSIPYAEGIEGISGTIISQDMQQFEIEFSATAPGEYRGILPENKQGAYIANLQIKKTGETETNVSTGVSIRYSDEYDIRNFDKGLNVLKSIASITGGELLDSPEQLFSPNLNKTFTENNISNLLLASALVLFMLDIAIRRFSVVTQKLNQAYNTAFNGIKAFLAPKKPVKSFTQQRNVSENTKTQVSETKSELKTTAKSETLDGKKVTNVKTTSSLLESKKKRSGR